MDEILQLKHYYCWQMADYVDNCWWLHSCMAGGCHSEGTVDM